MKYILKILTIIAKKSISAKCILLLKISNIVIFS